VGLPTKSPLTAALRGRRLERQGLALPAAIFALVAVSLLVVGLFAFADLSAKSVLNQERSTRAVQVAEAGMNHTLGLLRGSLRGHNFSRILKGSDGLNGTVAQRADDSLMIGYGLAAGDQIPLVAGKALGAHTYWVSVRDDPIDGDADMGTDLNGRVLVRCWSLTSDGARAEVAAIIGAVPMVGIVMDGNLEMSGSADIMGPCGSIHTNGSITGGGTPTVTAGSSATGTVGPGTLSPQAEGAPPMNVPDLNPANFCPPGPNTVNVTNAFWVPVATALVDGFTYCVTGVPGDVQLSNDFASVANKRAVSIIARGSIKISAKPNMKAAHPDGILLMAGGDLDLQGDWSGEGMLYAVGQCYIPAHPIINGQLICKNKPAGVGPAFHAGSDWVPFNLISGDAEITFDCSTNGFNKRRILSWYPRVGT
jgi:hypothetical protein